MTKQFCFKESWKILTLFSGFVYKILNLQIYFYWNVLFKRSSDIYFEPSLTYWHVVVIVVFVVVVQTIQYVIFFLNLRPTTWEPSDTPSYSTLHYAPHEHQYWKTSMRSLTIIYCTSRIQFNSMPQT